MREKAILIGVKFPQDIFEVVEESMSELGRLTDTAGADVVDTIIQSRSAVDPKFFIGKGKLEEIREFYENEPIDLVIFNHELSPSQARNVETELKVRVITRAELIMDIFAVHAQTKTARMQVELAQLKYQMPRLRSQQADLAQVRGVIGTRGPGEKTIETDKRVLRERIHFISGKLKEIDKSRKEQRKRRSDLFKTAIVGYTNSGKSTLLNAIVKSSVKAEDQLFATLDTTTRKLWLGDGVQVLLTDTVGFIKDLPHDLIQSFKSTLEETMNADMLVQVIDIASVTVDDQMRVVRETLADLETEKTPMLFCFNKIDTVDTERLLEYRMKYPDAVYISAKQATNIDSLKERIKTEAIKRQSWTLKD